jgi:hypothetical protein
MFLKYFILFQNIKKRAAMPKKHAARQIDIFKKPITS